MFGSRKNRSPIQRAARQYSATATGQIRHPIGGFVSIVQQKKISGLRRKSGERDKRINISWHEMSQSQSAKLKAGIQ